MDFDDLSKKTIDIAAVAADKAKDVAFLAADKAKDVAKLTKISVAIAGEQREIDKTYRTIGEWFVNEYEGEILDDLYYDVNKQLHEGEIPDGVKELVEAAVAAKARIAELEASKPAKSDEAGEAEFVQAEEGQRTCPICGAASDSKFCPHCGAPMGE